MNNAFLKSFLTLQQIYREKAFSTLALNKTLSFCCAKDKALVTKLVYGVLDNDIKIEYQISKYVKKMPKNDDVLIILKMGVYALSELSIPVYAVVNDLAELTKVTEDKRLVGFVNATLKNISKTIKEFDDYPVDAAEKLSVVNSYPEWAVRKLIKDYGAEVAEKIITYKSSTSDTVRIANPEWTEQNVKNKFDGCVVEKTVFPDAYAVRGKLPQPDGDFTVQSLSSMAIARAVANGLKGDFLDCCSAPGGKAVYVKQLCAKKRVVACDIHPHRVALIDSYAERMGVGVETRCKDMSQLYEEWFGAFDTVLCDAPCSGFGVLNNRPDIKLFRQNKDISDLMKLQYAILDACSNYVKVGGRLIYSTCTVFDNENGQNIRKFLKEHNNFRFGKIILPEIAQTRGQGSYQFLPHKDGMQGFFLAVLEKTE